MDLAPRQLRPSSLPPEMAAHFDVGAAVGKGANGVVYQGREKQLSGLGGSGAPVAIKAVATRFMARDKQDQLIQEIGTLKKCSHVNIVALKGFYASTTQVFIVMEWCSEGDLEGFITRRGLHQPGSTTLRVLAEHVALHFMRQLALALRFLRSIDTVHGDLKPANLLLTKASPSSGGASVPLPQLKVGDFGLAQSLSSEESSSRLQGTALYLAPELVISRSFNAGCDLWSSGSILHRMLFGWPAIHPPGPQQNNIDAALRRIAALGSGHNRDNPLALPSSHSSPKVSEACKDLLLKLLQPRPEQRITFDGLWSHHCIDLPSQKSAEAAAKSAEELASVAYASLDTNQAGANLVAAKNAFLDAGQRYLALEKDSGSGLAPEVARQCAFAMVSRAEELSDAAMQLGVSQPGSEPVLLGSELEPEPEPKPEPEPEPEQQDRGVRASSLSDGRSSSSGTCACNSATRIGPSRDEVMDPTAAAPVDARQQQRGRLASLAQIASQAVAADSAGHVKVALDLYVDVLERVGAMEMDGQIDPNMLQSTGLRGQFAEYSTRVAELEHRLQTTRAHDSMGSASSGRSSAGSVAFDEPSDGAAVDCYFSGNNDDMSIQSGGDGVDGDNGGSGGGTDRHVCSSACERPCRFAA